jgi:hypothetical protein
MPTNRVWCEMPFCEADPWRLQYFENVSCPQHVRIPTEDADAYVWYPAHSWIYDKLRIARSQGIEAAPHGVPPTRFPVFSKPITNLKGMGVDSRPLRSPQDYEAHYQPGHMWMALLEGEHVSTDAAVVDGEVRWWRHATGVPLTQGMFDYWVVHAAARPQLEDYLGRWLLKHMRGYTGLMNFETIGGLIIEAHMRFADQWPDLYGAGWAQAVVELYAGGDWRFADSARVDGFSVVLFGRHGHRYEHPPPATIEAVLSVPNVSSLQNTYHENREPAAHAMPPGGFRLGIINCTDLGSGFRARRILAAAYPSARLLLPKVSSFPAAARSAAPLAT